MLAVAEAAEAEEEDEAATATISSDRPLHSRGNNNSRGNSSWMEMLRPSVLRLHLRLPPHPRLSSHNSRLNNAVRVVRSKPPLPVRSPKPLGWMILRIH